ncbi:MAG: acyl-CoA/acyl-ACP dehydrogenase [Pseudonocardiales bacterium]|nr:acyl-CoA/acyl-ACP dehydrogenase [Pseudonocardiales bacterium]MBV9730880.1 acyl-CoA/acyl-ACP dehydrogenase [Pseudonocardiales bacterium]
MGDRTADFMERATNGQVTAATSSPWRWLSQVRWIFDTSELGLLGRADAILQVESTNLREGSRTLLEAKHRLHQEGIGNATAPRDVGGGGYRWVVQLLIQFLVGYRDLNMRDAAHLGHAELLLLDDNWITREELHQAVAGELIGVAATEPSGGSNLATASTTIAVPTPSGWELTGEKKWISRIEEAGAFVIFARVHDDIAAFYVRSTNDGLARASLVPSGLTGWSWGCLVLNSARVRTSDMIGDVAAGVSLFRRHFARYRPLVAATCLGAAAASIDQWVDFVLSRSDGGRVLMGGALEKIGQCRSRIILAISGLVAGAVQTADPDPIWAKMAKAHSVEVALETVRSAARSMGAQSYEAEHPVRRTLRNLEAFEYADGAIDPLFRSSGYAYVRQTADERV